MADSEKRNERNPEALRQKMSGMNDNFRSMLIVLIY